MSEPWYDELTAAEAREVAMLDASLEGIDRARSLLAERRGIIRNRVTMRRSGRLKSEERRLRWRKTDVQADPR